MKNKFVKKVGNFQRNKGKFVYVNSRRTKKIQKKTVLFEAVHGDTLSGHIYYLVKDIVDKNINMKIYVSLKNEEDLELFLPQELKQKVIFVKHMSNQYYELLATCEYLINDTTFYPFFNKREGQKYFIIWHGTPLKHMGRDIPKILDVANVQRNFYMADRIYVNNYKTMEILARTHHLNNIYTGKFIIGPSPRNSIFFDKKIRNNIRTTLHINDKKALVYMPTWRGSLGKVKGSDQIMNFMSYLEDNLEDDTIVYVKLHPFEKTVIPDTYEKVKPFPTNFEIYEFLAASDGLITDYSSVMYDYINLNKPVILYTYDFKEYVENRGVYDDLSTYPFEKTNNIEELLDIINSIPKQVDYKTFIDEFSEFDQANGSEIIVNHMLFGKEDSSIESHNLHNGKETVAVVSGGFWSNGITTALINTLENIDTNEKNYICFFEKNKVKKEHYYRLLNLPENVYFYPTVGEMNGSFKDRLLMKKYLWNEKFKFSSVEKQLERMFKEEFSRLFGDLKIDWFIHYTGFERKSAEMMRHINSKTAIWVHTDMFAEYEAKKNFSKKIIFGAYEKANKVVLVHNNLRSKLIEKLPNISDKVVTVNNFLGEERNRNLSMENLLQTIEPVHVDYSYNENIKLNYKSLDSEEMEIETLGRYPEKEMLKKNLIKNVENGITENNEQNTNSTLITHKEMLIKHIDKSFDSLYQNFIKDSELRTTFENLYNNNELLINEYFETKDMNPTVVSVDLFNKMRISKCKLLDAIFNPEIKVYLNIGRYDYQKGHDKLIEAFEQVYIENPNIFLIMICPHGPLKSQTIQWVRESVAKENIVILGGINNPYPLLKHVDAFVLSSNYEGLGLVVYEALSLNTDVITVNLKETTEYLNENQAIIVENTVDGLVEGFKIHLNDNKQFEEFDFDYYKEKSKQEYQNVIL
ncbi:CDP-glycerol glycerophosphotransferase family protein [Mammaliicoccus sp. D-M17]|uniref:CDP-glycerol glycerophosphotransferase family protein n=1 Tax=Mammaliicoccus sp. D-M17 TaxID=2898677 RepID=UPI001EFBA819|nr:CDP-glycerol glycerophosphotransferase family protein [Mammaliicoccus sp. D-M17]